MSARVRNRCWALIAALLLVPAVFGMQRTVASASSSFITVCGMQLCDGSQVFQIHGATAYGHYDDPSAEISLAQQAHINVLELVEFDTMYHQLSDVESEATWSRVDRFIAAARTAGIHVILHVAEYGQSLEAAGHIAETVDWGPYLKFIANRVNTVNGVRYADDSTIALLQLFGEIPQPNGQGTNGTPSEMQDFFKRSLAEWHTYAPNILGSTGGFSYLNAYQASGIPWQAIMSDPDNAACEVEVNSDGDRNITVPMVSSYCQSIHKPWFLSAWSSCLGPSAGSWDIDHWPDDASMASHAQDMESVAADNHPASPAPTLPGIGNDFWNLANTAVHVGTCDIGAQVPLTLSAVKAASARIATTTAAVQASPVAPVYGQPTQLRTGVTAQDNSAVSGTVTFMDGARSLGNAPVSAGAATLTVPSLNIGTRTVTATYNGDGWHNGSNSAAPLSVTVAPASTSVSVSMPNPAPAGVPVAVTAQVNALAPSQATVTGNVSFSVDGSSIGTAAIGSGGSARIQGTFSLGQHQITASYLGNAMTLASASAPYAETVLHASTVTINTSPQNLVPGTPVTLQAQVTSQSTPAPSGTVTFLNNGTAISGSLTLSSQSASFTTSSLAPGDNVIDALYSGDSTYAPETSESIVHVNPYTSLVAITATGALAAAGGSHVGSHGDTLSPIAPVRGAVLRGDGGGGYVLDGWGGIHPFGGAPAVEATGYWPGWNIARGIVLRSDGVSGYVLDGWGGLHPFGAAPALHASGYWAGWDIARSLALDANGTGGYVLDGWGGLHAFGDAPAVRATGYWAGWDIARAVVLVPGWEPMGYVLDGWGGLHPFGGAPYVRPGGYITADVFRSAALT